MLEVLEDCQLPHEIRLQICLSSRLLFHRDLQTHTHKKRAHTHTQARTKQDKTKQNKGRRADIVNTTAESTRQQNRTDEWGRGGGEYRRLNNVHPIVVCCGVAWCVALSGCDFVRAHTAGQHVLGVYPCHTYVFREKKRKTKKGGFCPPPRGSYLFVNFIYGIIPCVVFVCTRVTHKRLIRIR